MSWHRCSKPFAFQSWVDMQRKQVFTKTIWAAEEPKLHLVLHNLWFCRWALTSHPSLEVTKSFPLIAGTKWNQLSYIKDIQDWYKKKTFTFIAVFVTRGIYAQVTKLQRKRAPLTGQCPSTTRVPLLREFKFLLCKNLTKLSKSTLKRLE